MVILSTGCVHSRARQSLQNVACSETEASYTLKKILHFHYLRELRLIQSYRTGARERDKQNSFPLLPHRIEINFTNPHLKYQGWKSKFR